MHAPREVGPPPARHSPARFKVGALMPRGAVVLVIWIVLLALYTVVFLLRHESPFAEVSDAVLCFTRAAEVACG